MTSGTGTTSQCSTTQVTAVTQPPACVTNVKLVVDVGRWRLQDLSGRPHLSCNLNLPTERIGKYETQLVEHFFQSLANTSGMTLHIRQLAGQNSHHIVEATFKAFARALRQACEVDARRQGTIASSKGVLTQQ